MQHDACDQIGIEVIELPYVHYASAWKVAYADFMTAMMAFFLLMWLLNMTPQDTKEGIAEYFTPSDAMVSENDNGAGGILGGLTMTPEGARTSEKTPVIPAQPDLAQNYRGGGKNRKNISIESDVQRKRFEQIAEKIKQAVMEHKTLRDLMDNIEITITPEGLKIEIVDQESESMFPSGSASMFEKTRELLSQITSVIIEMPNELSIRGHTDGVRYADGSTYTNWELSVDRANAVRRAMLSSGFPDDRLHNVMGRADNAPLVEDNPLDPRNRRITLLLLNQALPDILPENGEADEVVTEAEQLLDGRVFGEGQHQTFRKTPGAVEFP
ncbi:MAG: flagellar motor protein MotB [Alphaproteobacteria bacterium]